ncbi:hypothetical protein STEG23_027756 [Scotinomys teguina]
MIRSASLPLPFLRYTFAHHTGTFPLSALWSQCNVLAYEKFFLLLAEFNSAMNPIIYSYRDKEMSATFRQILCCQRSENANGPTEGSDRSASSLNHTILAGAHSNDHSVV